MASATERSSPSTTSDMSLTCPLCEQHYKKPKVLSCLHSFCQACLDKQLQKEPGTILTCDVCEQETSLPSQGLSGLPDDFVARNTLENILLSSANIVCTTCTSKSAAVSRCMECASYICPNCVSAHNWMLCFQNHHVVPLEELQGTAGRSALQRPVFCSTHQGEPLKFYCNSCQVPICKECTVLDHAITSHNYVYLTDQTVALGNGLQALVEQSMDKAESLKKKQASLQDSATQIEKQGEEVIQQINETIADLKTVLEQCKEELVEELNDWMAGKQESLNQLQSHIQDTVDKINHGCKFTESLLRQGSHVEILSLQGQVERQLQSLLTFNPQHKAEIQFAVNADLLELIEKGSVGSLKSDELQTEPSPTSGEASPNDNENSPSRGSSYYSESGFSDGSGGVKSGSKVAGEVSNAGGAEAAPELPPKGAGRLPFEKTRTFSIHDTPEEIVIPPQDDSDVDGEGVERRTGSKSRIPDDRRQTFILKDSNQVDDLIPVVGDNNGNRYKANSPTGSFRGGRGSPNPDLPPRPPPRAPTGMQRKQPYQNGGYNKGHNFSHSISMSLEYQLGGYGQSPGLFNQTGGIVVSMYGDMYVADQGNHRIQVFDSRGNFKFQFGREGKFDGCLVYPNHLAITPDGNIAVNDPGNRRVQIFAPNGDYLGKFSVAHIKGVKDIAVSHEGQVLVLDHNAKCIHVFNQHGNLLQKLDLYKQLRLPTCVATMWTGDVIVADRNPHSIKIFDRRGNFLKQIPVKGFGYSPVRLCVDTNGNIVALHHSYGYFHITVFRPDGSTLVTSQGMKKMFYDFDMTPDGHPVVTTTDEHTVLYFSQLVRTGGSKDKFQL
ncbi:PREDICTED: brain tumor protein-like [Branchiostoma belcheri]|uniref:RING-type E3 ubiquitin transferase n=1 Tax=Branchiostoma belcheri TaxID=7741 RepID=A0A6P5AVC7_BRABE|nr:PREDICTED: brain tumor protein-like [Branchiostoma belcheri]XP_019645921.1 PREDICTED: brain tumor protein-like [Branchiostoma belcheri]